MCDSSYSITNHMHKSCHDVTETPLSPSHVPSHVKAWIAVKEVEIDSTIMQYKLSRSRSVESCESEEVGQATFSRLSSCESMCSSSSWRTPGAEEEVEEEECEKFGRCMFTTKKEHQIGASSRASASSQADVVPVPAPILSSIKHNMCDSSYSITTHMHKTSSCQDDTEMSRSQSQVPSHIKDWIAVREVEIDSTIMQYKLSTSRLPSVSGGEELCDTPPSSESSYTPISRSYSSWRIRDAEVEESEKFGRHMFETKKEHQIACLLASISKLSS
eukprot:CAMPEP_0181344726 /NCGR_PEP_ID=MMETSP1101-20121128/32342_1 /TAXON_ID=46948 /ORGANISM="Rhodomonas abbreviata, Strain Caron Lab Isolate" /LENGTH=273 /DNA_ID=CAMNT_0023456579 /DNA_START=81 /DNA_END=903 /DNA_ORIENTATION=+